jgi:hypothetical protein
MKPSRRKFITLALSCIPAVALSMPVQCPNPFVGIAVPPRKGGVISIASFNVKLKECDRQRMESYAKAFADENGLQHDVRLIETEGVYDAPTNEWKDRELDEPYLRFRFTVPTLDGSDPRMIIYDRNAGNMDFTEVGLNHP